MELKVALENANVRWLRRFNRTFMELKEEALKWFDYPYGGFNRTFMELKVLNDYLTNYSDKVSIAPLWN